MNWLQKMAQFGGDCGMYAIALGKRAQEAGHKVTMVVCSNESSSEELMHGEPTVYHIAVEINGNLYDGRGKTTLQELGEISAEYQDYQPNCSFFDLDESFIAFVRTQTNWSTSWEDYYRNISLEGLI